MPNKIDVTTCDPDLVNCARRSYRAYADNSDGKTFDGRTMPTWEKLTAAVQSHWCAATIEAARYASELMRSNASATAAPKKEPAPLPPAPTPTPARSNTPSSANTPPNPPAPVAPSTPTADKPGDGKTSK